MKKRNSTTLKTERMMMNHIVMEKGYSEQTSRWMVSNITAMTDFMQHGNVLLAYRLRRGNFRLEKISLRNYEHVFKRPYDLKRLTGGTLVFYSIDRSGWHTMQIDNFMGSSDKCVLFIM